MLMIIGDELYKPRPVQVFPQRHLPDPPVRVGDMRPVTRLRKAAPRDDESLLGRIFRVLFVRAEPHQEPHDIVELLVVELDEVAAHTGYLCRIDNRFATGCTDYRAARSPEFVTRWHGDPCVPGSYPYELGRCCHPPRSPCRDRRSR